MTYNPTRGVVEALPEISPTPSRSSSPAVFIGDSYTQGTGASSEERRWTTLVAEDRGWDEINLGLGGTGYLTTAGIQGCGQDFCPNYQEVVIEAADLKPRIVIVSGGQNDFLKFGQDPATVKNAINGTLKDLRKSLPKAKIVVVGPSTTGKVRGAVVDMDAAVQKSSRAVGATYISLLKPRSVIEADMVLPDKTHVDDSGHRAIAQRVLQGLS